MTSCEEEIDDFESEDPFGNLDFDDDLFGATKVRDLSRRDYDTYKAFISTPLWFENIAAEEDSMNTIRDKINAKFYSGCYEETIALCEGWLEKENSASTRKEFQETISLCYLKLGDLEKAEKHIQISQTLDTNICQVCIEVCEEQRRYKDMINFCHIFLSSLGTSTYMWSKLAAAYLNGQEQLSSRLTEKKCFLYGLMSILQGLRCLDIACRSSNGFIYERNTKEKKKMQLQIKSLSELFEEETGTLIKSMCLNRRLFSTESSATTSEDEEPEELRAGQYRKQETDDSEQQLGLENYLEEGDKKDSFLTQFEQKWLYSMIPPSAHDLFENEMDKEEVQSMLKEMCGIAK